MNSSEKSCLTSISKIESFSDTYTKLVLNQPLNENEKSYILSAAILFIKAYESDKRCTSYLDFAYNIILKYSITYEDYKPLLDFATNFGFYPITKSIYENNLVSDSIINNLIIEESLEDYRTASYIETYEQRVSRNTFLANDYKDLAYIAPTSFGKSSLIYDYIRMNSESLDKIAIIVPTKSLLMQVYRQVRELDLKYKILTHDDMYAGESKFIAIFTQERALRLIAKHNVYFDILFIDEAHKLLNKDNRSILLTRLIKKCILLNPECKTIYISPLVEDQNNLRHDAEQTIDRVRINFNLKSPEIYQYCKDGTTLLYNRFLHSHIEVDNNPIEYFEYINNNTVNKNFFYLLRPKKIEEFAQELYQSTSKVKSTKINELIEILKENVHEDFYMVELLKNGIIYLHGKLPDLIKEYLEYKYTKIGQIKYLVANTVILEGVNLPIETLFILNTHLLDNKDLTNLIGRVNRLNQVFTPNDNNLYKLLPQIHFLNSDKYSSATRTMSSKINSLRSNIFKDQVDNPLLDSFNYDKADDKVKNTVDILKNNEEFLLNSSNDPQFKIKTCLLENGIDEYYRDLETLINNIEQSNCLKDFNSWSKMDLIEKISTLFIRNNIENVSNYELARLQHDETISFYISHIRRMHRYSIKKRIELMHKYFVTRIEDGKEEFFVGSTYGEIAKSTSNYKEAFNEVYVNLRTKKRNELINLAIVKLKMEDDFVSYHLNKFVVFLHELKLITDDEYNNFAYGTTNSFDIELVKLGLNSSLVTRLRNDNQLSNLYFDKYNNLRAKEDFNEYKDSLNDFNRFEIERYL